MKKILCTTALASTLLVSANALAQTTVTGQLDLGYVAKSMSTGNGATSNRSFTRESQINVANKGKLSNGIDYAAGFSWEIDGNEALTSSSAAFGENTYIDFIMGKTTLTIGADHIQNPNFEITNLAGGVSDIDDLVYGYVDAATTSVVSLAANHSTNTANSASQGYGIGIIQDFGIAKASLYYAPDRNTGRASANDSTGVANTVDAGNSQIEAMIRGNFGVKGLDAFVYMGKAESDTPGTVGSTNDTEGRKYGLSYNFGQFSLAASQSKVESLTGVEAKTNSFGTAFAVNKEVTIGLLYAKTEADALVSTSARSATAIPDETLKSINIGYNLGPVVMNTMYVDGSDVGGVAANDVKALHINFTTKF
jgi:hypothetical protein